MRHRTLLSAWAVAASAGLAGSPRDPPAETPVGATDPPANVLDVERFGDSYLINVEHARRDDDDPRQVVACFDG